MKFYQLRVLNTEVSSFEEVGIEGFTEVSREVSLYTEVSSFQGVRIEVCGVP